MGSIAAVTDAAAVTAANVNASELKLMFLSEDILGYLLIRSALKISFRCCYCFLLQHSQRLRDWRRVLRYSVVEGLSEEAKYIHHETLWNDTLNHRGIETHTTAAIIVVDAIVVVSAAVVARAIILRVAVTVVGVTLAIVAVTIASTKPASAFKIRISRSLQ